MLNRIRITIPAVLLVSLLTGPAIAAPESYGEVEESTQRQRSFALSTEISLKISI